MPTRPIRIAVVGTGFGARIHVPGLRLSGRFEVVALVGRDPERLTRAAARAGVARTCRSLEEALGLPALDAVSIATPPLLHAEQAIAAARAGKHVLCEKPMARTTVEARAMSEAASAAGVVALIDHEFRFDPARALLARLLTTGDLGQPRLATAIANMPHFIDPWRPPPTWWFSAAAGGGWLGACGSHAIDALRLWLGPFAKVAALVDSMAPRTDVVDPADDTFSLVFRTGGGTQGIIQQSAASWGPRLEVLRLACSEATAWIDDAGRLWRADRERLQELPIPDDLRLPHVAIPENAGPFASRELPAFVRLAERFADLIEGAPPRFPPPATFADGEAVQAVIDAARASILYDRWIAPERPEI